jgi:hypothetical protein
MDDRTEIYCTGDLGGGIAQAVEPFKRYLTIQKSKH